MNVLAYVHDSTILYYEFLNCLSYTWTQFPEHKTLKYQGKSLNAFSINFGFVVV